MTAVNKILVNSLIGKSNTPNESFSIEDMINEQESFFKAVRDYANSANVVELIKVANIVNNEICNRAEFGQMFSTPTCTSTPKKCDTLFDPLHLKKE